MKKLLWLALFIANGHAAFAQLNQNSDSAHRYAPYPQQNTDVNNTSLPYMNPHDPRLNPSVCDTLFYILRKIDGNYKTALETQNEDTFARHDTSMVNPVSYGRPVQRMNDNIVTGQPYVFYCPYRDGKDSAQMFNVFTTTAMQIKECLLAGPVKAADMYVTHDIENHRIIRYEFVIRDMKTPMDAALVNTIIQVQYWPETETGMNDNFTNYRVALIVHP